VAVVPSNQLATCPSDSACDLRDSQGTQCLIFLCWQGKSLTCDGRDDAAEFADVRSAMKVLNFSDEEILNIIRLLGAILHLGNVKYNELIIGKFHYSCNYLLVCL
jgi:myosin heavy subunit